MTDLDIKAREIVISFQFQNPPLNFDLAKNCAIINVKNIIDVLGDEGVYAFADPKVSEKWERILSKIEEL